MYLATKVANQFFSATESISPRKDRSIFCVRKDIEKIGSFAQYLIFGAFSAKYLIFRKLGEIQTASCAATLRHGVQKLLRIEKRSETLYLYLVHYT